MLGQRSKAQELMLTNTMFPILYYSHDRQVKGAGHWATVLTGGVAVGGFAEHLLFKKKMYLINYLSYKMTIHKR